MEDLKVYEDIWCRSLNANFKAKDCFEVSIENDEQLNQELKSIESYEFENKLDAVSSCISDKNLYQRLKNNIEYLDLDELFIERAQVDEAANADLCQMDKDGSDYFITKLKNSNMINTRTGLKYKAPMRGGHSNQVQRHMTNNSTLNLSNNGKLSCFSIPQLVK